MCETIYEMYAKHEMRREIQEKHEKFLTVELQGMDGLGKE